IVAATRLGKSGRVIAFEPSSRERERMRLHLRRNKIEGVRLESYALAAERVEASFSVVVDVYSTMINLRPPVDHAVEKVAVEAILMDDYLRENGIDRDDLLKIDTDGEEVDVFRVDHRLYTQVRALIICEMLDQVTLPWGFRAVEIIIALSKFNYQ